MRIRVCGAVSALALALAAGLSSPASAQQKPSIAIMPVQHFSATQESAANVTRGLTQQFEGQGYTVMSEDRSRSTFQSLNLGASSHYADKVAVRFGRSIGSDLVAYPRLLAVGVPLAGIKEGDFLQPAAVIHLRVLNVHTGQPIYFRQIAHEFTTDNTLMPEFTLPQPVATATANEVSTMYFQRVAGSRQEFRGSR